MSILSSVGALVVEMLETVVVSLVICLLVYLFVAQPFQVKGDSMLPNFHDGQYMLTSKLTYKFKEPARGDVIVFEYPNARQYDYIKRIIGLPGETIEIKAGAVYINEIKLVESYIPETTPTLGKSFLKEYVRYEIPEGNYAVLGDNRERSSDSRQWGFLPKENIVGNSWLRYWPLKDFSVIKSPTW